jgi:hypothetical protein
MWCTAVTCSPRISGVAAMAGVDVNQPRAKGNATGSSGRSCTAERRRLAGSGIGVVLCKRALSPAKHVLGDLSHQIRPKIDAGDASLIMGSIN